MFGAPFGYLQNTLWARLKFSRGLFKKVSAQNMRFCQNIPTPFWASFCQSLNFFHFSWHRIWLVCRVVTIFSLTQISRPGEHFRYLEHVRKVHRKFPRGLWKKFSSRNKEEIKLKIRLEYSDKTSCFELKILISKPSSQFSVELTDMFEVSEMFAWPSYLHQWKNRDHTTSQSDSISGKVKKVETLTKWS